MKKFYLSLLFIGFVFTGFGQIFSNNCSDTPEGWLMEGSQESGYYLIGASDPIEDYVYSPVYDLSSYTDLILVSNLRSYGGGTLPSCVIEFSIDGGTTWTGGSKTFENIPNSYIDKTWNIGTINSSNVMFRWTNSILIGRGLRINNLELTGVISGPDNPTAITAIASSTSQIDLGWNDNTDEDEVLLAWNTTNTFGTPENGTNYSSNDIIPDGGGTVLQYSSTDSYNHTSLDPSTPYFYKIWSYDGLEYSSGIHADAITLGPSISISESTLTGFDYTVGYGPSAEQSFCIEGSYLSNNISLSPPANYEISISTGGSFSAENPLILTQVGGDVANTTIYTRLKSALAIGDFNEEEISASSNGAITQTVTCSGSVSAPADPISFSALGSSISQIDLAFILNENSNDIIIVFDEDASFDTPSGLAPTSGDFSGGTVIYNGAGNSFNHTELSAGITYYYKAWSYDASNNYSSGIEREATTLSVISNLPYEEDFSNCDHQEWTSASVASDKEWACDYGYQSISGYLGDVASDDYLISPEINLDNYSSELLSFDSYTKYTDISHPTISLLYTTAYTGDPSSTTWNPLSANWPLQNSKEWTSSGGIDLSGISGSNVRLAFHYTSSGTANGEAESWRISNISITGIGMEPSNHISNFVAAASSSSQIDLSWNDNDGVLAASGILILASTSNAFTAPVDGVVQVDDIDLSDGFGVYNAAHGEESYSWTGLTTGQKYYFKAYPYTNAGTDINYKVDGIIPSAHATPTAALGKTYELITALVDLTDGYYVIVNENDNVAMSNVNEGVYFSETDITPSGNSIINPDPSIVWKIETHTDGGRTIYNEASAKYASLNYDANSCNAVDAVTNGKQRWTFTYSSDVFEAANMEYPLRDLQYNASTPRFACYTSAQQNLHLYKFVATPGLWKVDAASETWNDGANWLDGNIPTAATDVIIPTGCAHFPTISNDAVCHDLRLKSDVSGDASLKGQGKLTVSGVTTVERYFSGYTSNGSGWHFISSPVNNMTIAGSDFVSGDYDLYRWGETTDAEEQWLNYKAGNFDHEVFVSGMGYLAAINSGGVKEFIGALNTSSYSITLTNTGGHPDDDGWNLIGNPYPSGLDWNELDKDAGVINAFYIVDPDGSYNSSNGSIGDLIPANEIPPHQGFFIQVSAETSIGIEPADQKHTTNSFYKSELQFDEVLVVDLLGENSSSKTYFQFRNDASLDFDHHADARKLFGWASKAQVYSELNDTKYAINCLPHSDETITVSLGLQLYADEELSLDFSGMDSFFNSVRIDLEDRETGVMINIRENPSYTFQATTEDHANRFLLHFNGVTAVEELSDENAPQVYAVEDLIYINHVKDLDADIFIYATNGQLVGQAKMSKESMKCISVNGRTGIYLVTIQTEDAVYTEKVFVK